MSDHAPTEHPPVQAVQELDQLVRRLADELAGFRRRALTAEARLREIESRKGGPVNLDLANRCTQLEQENEQLQAKLETATSRARMMLDRVRFLRQQAQAGASDR